MARGKKQFSKSGISVPSYSDIKSDMKPVTVEGMKRGYDRLMADALWYVHYEIDTKTLAKEYLKYISKHVEDGVIKVIKKVPDFYLQSAGKVAYIANRGATISEEHHQMVLESVDFLVERANAITNDVPQEEKVEKKRPNVQEIMREKTLEAGGEIEGIFDEFIDAGYPKTFNKESAVISALETRNILPQHIPILLEDWNRAKEEYMDLQKGEDKELVEAYNHMTKMKIRYTLAFIDQVISTLNSYVTLKKAQQTRKPRARKEVPVEKIVSKLKHMKSFKDDVHKLDLKSISPTKLHGSSEAWVYDTKKRKLHWYVADDMVKEITVKGTSIIGFDPTKSGIKTLRKPGEQIKEVMGSKPAARKFFAEIKSVQTKATGRFNDDLIILRAW